jgi:hypothetical protein
MGANSTEREGARDARARTCNRTKGAIEPRKEHFYALVVELGMEHGALDILHAHQPAAPLRATARREWGAGGGARAGKPLNVAPERRRERPCRPDECDERDGDAETVAPHRSSFVCEWCVTGQQSVRDTRKVVPLVWGLDPPVLGTYGDAPSPSIPKMPAQ